MSEYFPGGVQRSLLGIGPMGGLFGSAPGFSDYTSNLTGGSQGYSAPSSLADLFTSGAGSGGYAAPQMPYAPQTFAPLSPMAYEPFIIPEPTSYAPPAAQPAPTQPAPASKTTTPQKFVQTDHGIQYIHPASGQTMSDTARTAATMPYGGTAYGLSPEESEKLRSWAWNTQTKWNQWSP